MTGEPLVSIVITSYNYARFLPDAIESALAQQHAPLEVLLLDNASTDDTPAVIARYADDPRLRVIRNPTNIGLTPNHNKGLREARGAYISFLSADDALTPDFVKRALRFYADHPDVDVLYGGGYFMDENGRVTQTRVWPGQPPAAYTHRGNELATLLAQGAYMWFPSLLVPRWVWERFGELDGALISFDWEITSRWSFNGIRFGFDPQPFVYTRRHDLQASGWDEFNASGREMREYVTIFERYLDPTVPERYAGHEAGIRRTIDNRERFARSVLGPAAAEFDAPVAALRARLETIAAANAARPRERIAFLVLSTDDELGPLGATLESLIAQSDARWRAVVAQQPGVDLGPLCGRVDATRIRHLKLVASLGTAAVVNAAISIEDADVYVVLRAGARPAPEYVAAVRATFADPATRVAFAAARLFVDTQAAPFGASREVSVATSRSDLASVPPAPEAIAFARTAFAELGGYREHFAPLADWDFALRLSVQDGVRACAAEIEVHYWPQKADAWLADPRAPNAVSSLYQMFPVTDLGRMATRAGFLERLRAAQHHDRHTASGLAAFFADVFA